LGAGRPRFSTTCRSTRSSRARDRRRADRAGGGAAKPRCQVKAWGGERKRGVGRRRRRPPPPRFARHPSSSHLHVLLPRAPNLVGERALAVGGNTGQKAAAVEDGLGGALHDVRLGRAPEAGPGQAEELVERHQGVGRGRGRRRNRRPPARRPPAKGGAGAAGRALNGRPRAAGLAPGAAAAAGGQPAPWGVRAAATPRRPPQRAPERALPPRPACPRGLSSLPRPRDARPRRGQGGPRKRAGERRRGWGGIGGCTPRRAVPGCEHQA
jgi:hypothetical protein